MIFDSHCHYNLDPLHQEWQRFQQQSLSAGVVGALVPGVDEDSTKKGAELSASSRYFHYSVGIHPVTAGERQHATTLNDLEELFNIVNSISAPIAIGETGLDFFHLPGDQKIKSKRIKKQRQSFESHIELAQKYSLPIIIHVRDHIENFEKPDSAYWQTLSILKNTPQLKPIILHCISGPQKYVEQAVSQGAYISFAGNCTYPSASSIRDLINLVPSDKILVETDAPYLPPQSHRGECCLPEYIVETVTKLQTAGVSSEKLITNAKKAFSLTNIQP